MANNTYVYELVRNAASVNQGAQGTPIKWKRIKALLMTPVDTYYTPTQLSTLRATLQAANIAADPYARNQVIGTIQETEDKSTDPKTLSYTYGQENEVYPGQYAFSFMFGDNDLAKQMTRQKYNGRADEFWCFLLDEGLNIIGTKRNDGSDNVVFGGFSIQEMQARNVKLDAGEGAKQGMFISFADSTEFNNGNLMVIAAGFKTWTEIKNVTDVKLTQLSALSTRTIGLAAIMEGGEIGTNIAERSTMSAVFVANPSLIVGKNKTAGTALTTSTVAVTTNAAGQYYFSITFASTNFPTTGQVLEIYFDSIANLAAQGLKYFETPVHFTVTIP
jgi:hypothetical protein